jgi:hypothetical protein
LTTLFLVTIKLPKNPNHNPHAKVIGECPFGTCTDSTGEHHTGVVRTLDEAEGFREAYRHITRIEEVIL